ncbi:MAG: hypothetical protein M3R47_19340, partial [Chloroflexota bacterium]|nr:hypothetical protein [Chloroflexota bacterium]
MANAIKNAINKRKGLFFVVHKNIATLILLSMSGTVTGVFFFFLTKWSLAAFVPQIPSEIRNIVSLGIWVIYGVLGMSQYYT